MRASIQNRNRNKLDSEIERRAELTRVERERTESTTSCSSNTGGIEDNEADTGNSETEDVFESP